MLDPAAPSAPLPSTDWLVFACPSCAQSVKIRAAQAGAALQCPSCQQRIQAPGIPEETQDVAPKFRSFAEPEFAVPEGDNHEKHRKKHHEVAEKNLPEWEKDPTAVPVDDHLDRTTTTVAVEVQPDGSVLERRKRTERKVLPSRVVKIWKSLARMGVWTLAALGLLVVVGAVFAGWYLARGKSPEVTIVTSPAELFVQRTYVSMDEREAAVAIVRDFLRQEGTEGKLPFVRFSDQPQMRLIMDQWYRAHPDKVIEIVSDDLAIQLSKFLYVNGMKFVVVTVQDAATLEYKFYAVQVIGEGQERELRVDWETAVGWQAMTLTEFKTGKPTAPQPFRVHAQVGDYYNGPYEDETKWLCCELTYPGDDDFRLWGYVERDTPAGQRLMELLDGQSISCILDVAFRLSGGTDNQVTIHGIAAEEWFLADGPAQGIVNVRPDE